MKKVLIITYYWPPAGGAGVQRALKFVKYLPQFGWEPVVLTVKNSDSPVEDMSLLNDIPNGCKIYKTNSLEPFNLYKKITGKKNDEKIPGDILLNDNDSSIKNKIAKWIRLNLFIPDAKVGWKSYAVKKGIEIIRQENIELIFSTSPPQTSALIGRKLAKQTGVKWIADFRDPWLDIVYYQNVKRSIITKKIDAFWENKVIKDADAIVTISKNMSELFRTKSKNARIEIIPNGYDESDFDQLDRKKNESFTIAYTGAMSKDRVPYPLLHALNRLVFEDDIKNIKLNFAGKFCKEFNDEISNNNLSEFVSIKNFVPHKESTKILQTSDLLLLVIDNVPNNKGFLTGKIFEYMGCRKPIFAIGPTDGDAANIIQETNCGTMVDYDDIDRAYEVLKKMYKEWGEGKSNYKFNSYVYSRVNLAKNLKKLFDEITL